MGTETVELLLSTIDKLNDGQQMILGVDKKDIGTHSRRKGCPSYLLGIVDGPDPVKVYLRAGWSLGNVQDRYIYEGMCFLKKLNISFKIVSILGKGGDQLCGRYASGLETHSTKFASLPPHDIAALGNHDWESLISGYASFPDSFKTTLPFLLASLVYHADFLRDELDPQHPLFSSRLFTGGYLERLHEKVISGVYLIPLRE